MHTILEQSDVQQDSAFLPLSFCTITENLRQKAEKELYETEERRKECLTELKVLIKSEEKFEPKNNEEFLLMFLRAKKFNTRAAFNLLKNYYGHRLRYPSLYSSFTPKQNVKVLKENIMNFLRLRTSDGCSVWVSRAGRWEPEFLSYEEILRFGLLCHDKELQNPVTQICGIVSIVDLKGFSWRHLFHMPASSIRCFVSATQDSLPIRHKAVHVINNPSIFSFLFALLKPLLHSKIRNRIHFHGDDMSSLHHFIPPALLPEEYGGENGPFENDEFYMALHDSEKEFEEDQQYGYCK